MYKQLSSDEILAGLQAKADNLAQELQGLEAHAEDVRVDRQKALTAIDQVTAVVEDANRLIPIPSQPFDPLSPAYEAMFDTTLDGLEVCFDGTKNLKERILRIAEQVSRKNKVLNTSAVTKFLMQSGQADTDKADNLRPSVHRVFADQPEVYEKLAAGRWTLIQKDGSGLNQVSSEDVRNGYETDNS